MSDSASISISISVSLLFAQGLAAPPTAHLLRLLHLCPGPQDGCDSWTQPCRDSFICSCLLFTSTLARVCSRWQICHALDNARDRSRLYPRDFWVSPSAPRSLFWELLGPFIHSLCLWFQPQGSGVERGAKELSAASRWTRASGVPGQHPPNTPGPSSCTDTQACPHATSAPVVSLGHS